MKKRYTLGLLLGMILSAISVAWNASAYMDTRLPLHLILVVVCAASLIMCFSGLGVVNKWQK